MRDRSEMSAADLERVETYLNSPMHQVERRPFRFWRLMGFLSVTIILFGILAMYVAIEAGVWNSGRWR